MRHCVRPRTDERRVLVTRAGGVLPQAPRQSEKRSASVAGPAGPEPCATGSACARDRNRVPQAPPVRESKQSANDSACVSRCVTGSACAALISSLLATPISAARPNSGTVFDEQTVTEIFDSHGHGPSPWHTG